jgi:hypothetical protein
MRSNSHCILATASAGSAGIAFRSTQGTKIPSKHKLSPARRQPQAEDLWLGDNPFDIRHAKGVYRDGVRPQRGTKSARVVCNSQQIDKHRRYSSIVVARLLRVSRNTVLAAYDDLAADNLAEKN